MDPDPDGWLAGLPLAVEVTDLHVRRGEETILDGVRCRLPAGRVTALLGPNGCGKTTLTRCLTADTPATSGSITVLGETIGRCDARRLRRRIGVVRGTVDGGGVHREGAVVDADLLAIEAVQTGFFGTVGLYDAPSREQRDRAEAVLRQVGLGRRLTHRVDRLSTGEQRRCLLARALVCEPELLILDEPTAGLDVAGREQLLAVVDAITHRSATAKDRVPAVLYITHHVEELSPRTAQVLLMKQGRIAAAGRPDRVITPESLTSVFGCPVYVRRVWGRWQLEVLPEAWASLMPGGASPPRPGSEEQGRRRGETSGG